VRRALVLAALALGPTLRADDADVKTVAEWLAGTFTSPAAELPNASGPTRIVSVLVPKSRIGLGAPVLYVETAPASNADRPYRQQFWRVEDDGPGRVRLKLFEPKDRIAVSGKWRDPSDLALFGERDVVERKACDLDLTKGDGVYYGSTMSTGCSTPLGGARYVTGRLVVAPSRLQVANTGFDAAGRKLWGGVDLAFERGPAAPTLVPTPAASAPTLVPTRAAVPAPPSAVAPPPAPAQKAPTPAPPVLAGSALIVRLPNGAQKTLTLPELERLHAVTSADGHARGAPLREVLAAAGADVSEKKRASLAACVLVVYGTDDETAVLALDEIFSERAPIVAWEADGKPLAAGDGPLRVVVPGSPARSIRKPVLLEVRDLGAGGAALPR
jgi:hypothetical protein